MINHLDNLLLYLFMSKVTGLKTPNPAPGQPPYPVNKSQIGFRPPDDNWRTYVTNLSVNNQPAKALNVYLVDLRENRKLRSNERIRDYDYENGNVTETPAPKRIDCHYLITAWSPPIINPATNTTTDDEYVKLHSLIYETMAVLFKNAPLVPQQIYSPNPLPPNFPQVIADVELPTTVLPTEGFSKLAEFWSAMGANYRWLPVLYLIVTLPVELDIEIAGPMVSSRATEYRHLGRPETVEARIQIGGQVLDTTSPLPDGSPSPVADAWVRLEDANGTTINTTETGNDGRFTFDKLLQGDYILRVRVRGRPPVIQPIQVTLISGDYNILLT